MRQLYSRAVPPPRWLFAGALVGLIGCQEAKSPVAPSVVHGRPVSINRVSDTTAWDTFVTDLTVQNARFDASGKQIFGEHPLRYHLERSLRDGKHWSMVVTFASRARAVVVNPAGNFNPEAHEAARLEDDGDGTPPRVYDGLGRLMSKHGPALPASVNKAMSPQRAALEAGLAQLKKGGTAARPTSMDRKWVGSFVFQPESGSARAAGFARRYGQPHRTAAGTDEYVGRQDSTRITVNVDPSTNAIVGMTEAVNGATRRHWTYAYDKTPEGIATKKEVRVESNDAAGTGSRVMVMRYSNTHFEKRGQP